MSKFYKRNLIMGLTVLFLLASCAFAFAADIPAYTMKAPIPQDVGILDKLYENFTEADCRNCHGVNTADLHHMTATALDTSDPTKGCIACHKQNADGTIATPISRACSDCHPTSWHHTTAAAQAGTCTACHEPSLLSDQGTGFAEDIFPTYNPSDVTPSVKDCANCHNDFNLAWDPTTQSGGSDPNSLSHHGIKLGECLMCHDFGNINPITNGVQIRVCESCHTVPSLHTIAAHTDNNNKCLGCHGTYISGEIPVNSTVAPTTSGVDKTSARQLDYVVISGANFGAYIDRVKVYLGDSLDPAAATVATAPISSMNDSEIRVMIPTAAPLGTHYIWVNVNGQPSNKQSVTVVSAPKITTLSAGTPNGNLISVGPSASIPSGKFGDTVVLQGTNLTTGIGSLTVTMVNGSTKATITPTAIQNGFQFVLPKLIPGKYLVRVSNSYGISNSVDFIVGETPKITSVQPSSVALGKTTVIYGSNLNIGVKPTVTIGGVSATVGTASATKVYVTVPTTVAKGTRAVVINNGFANSLLKNITVK